MLRPILIATLIAGTLDILSAFLFAGMAGMKPLGVLRFVASGPFGAAEPTPAWAAIGLAVHFAIMACMAAAYMLVASRIPALLRHPILAGLAYGLLLWLVMYWIVLPQRFGMPLPNTLWAVSNQLFSHCILTGIPIALVARRYLAAPEPGPA
jgi:ABC-type amino acid transport system permease subunit